jgi:hypothetical protein
LENFPDHKDDESETLKPRVAELCNTRLREAQSPTVPKKVVGSLVACHPEARRRRGTSQSQK